MTDKFRGLLKDMRFAKPGDDVSQLVARTRVLPNGLRAIIACHKCLGDIWEKDGDDFYCWNCGEASTSKGQQ